MKFQFQGGEKSSNSDNDGQQGRGGGTGVKNLKFYRTSFVNGPLTHLSYVAEQC